MSKKFILGLVLGFCLIRPTYANNFNAQDFDAKILDLTRGLSQTLVKKGKTIVASIDFVDLQGRSTELGRFLAEQVSVKLVNETGITVVDRANFQSILKEHHLSVEGLINPENVKKLGRFSGVDVIIVGTLTPMDDCVVLMVKAISTVTAERVAAKQIKIRNSDEFERLMRHPLE